MKNIFAVLLLTIFAMTAQSAELETIASRMEDESFGEAIEIAELQGQYLGTCYDGKRTTTEALYVDSFVNAAGNSVDLGLSTLQTYGGSKLPDQLSFLLQPGVPSWNYIKNLVTTGSSGTDNNKGRVSPGADFQYLYSSRLEDKTLVVSVDLYRNCSAGVCNPPLLQACRNGYDRSGHRWFEGCIRNSDKTSFKKESATTLISHRTAESVGEATTSLSFYLAPISTYCRWNKLFATQGL